MKTFTNIMNRIARFSIFGLFGFLMLWLASLLSPVMLALVISYPIGRSFWALLNGRAIASWIGRKASKHDTIDLRNLTK